MLFLHACMLEKCGVPGLWIQDMSWPAHCRLCKCVYWSKYLEWKGLSQIGMCCVNVGLTIAIMLLSQMLSDFRMPPLHAIAQLYIGCLERTLAWVVFLKGAGHQSSYLPLRDWTDAPPSRNACTRASLLGSKDLLVDLRKRHRSVWPTEDPAEHGAHLNNLLSKVPELDSTSFPA